MKIRDLIKQLEDMLLIYGDRTILTITDIESEYSIKEIKGKMCAKYFEPSDRVAEVTVIIKRNSSIKTLPSVTPERKTGKWIVHYECPKCGEITKDFTEYCPFCNADMRGKQDEPNK